MILLHGLITDVFDASFQSSWRGRTTRRQFCVSFAWWEVLVLFPLDARIKSRLEHEGGHFPLTFYVQVKISPVINESIVFYQSLCYSSIYNQRGAFSFTFDNLPLLTQSSFQFPYMTEIFKGTFATSLGPFGLKILKVA